MISSEVKEINWPRAGVFLICECLLLADCCRSKTQFCQRASVPSGSIADCRIVLAGYLPPYCCSARLRWSYACFALDRTILRTVDEA
jgi:hypothetical protein